MRLAPLLLFAALAPAQGRIATVDEGRRVALTAESKWPAWAKATAKVSWLRKDGRVGVGSAVLVAPRLAMTAAHCARGWAKPARFQFGYDGVAKRALAVRLARRVVASSLAGDWAIVELDRPVAGIAPLKLATKRLKECDKKSVIVAGYSCDETLGRAGRLLTYDAKARIKKVRTPQGRLLTDAAAYQGASGGPLLVREKEGSRYHWFGLVQGNINASSPRGFVTYAVYQVVYARALREALAELG